MKISDKYYDLLCWIGRLFLPALATFIATLGNELGLPYGEIASKVIMALDVFLNGILAQSSLTYYKNKDVTEDEEEVIEYDNHIAE